MTTTEAKAKEVKMLIDRYVTLAKRAQDESRRLAVTRLLMSRLSKVAVKKLLSADFLKRMESRNSGYTSIVKIGSRRSDSAPMAVIEFVFEREPKKVHSVK
jgi:large subunit ribosomal protein L17